VNIPDGTETCERRRLVKIQGRVSGNWRTVRRDRTNASGDYRAALPDNEGTYRSVRFGGSDFLTTTSAWATHLAVVSIAIPNEKAEAMEVAEEVGRTASMRHDGVGCET
jgi:hypothetical protein